MFINKITSLTYNHILRLLLIQEITKSPPQKKKNRLNFAHTKSSYHKTVHFNNVHYRIPTTANTPRKGNAIPLTKQNQKPVQPPLKQISSTAETDLFTFLKSPLIHSPRGRFLIIVIRTHFTKFSPVRRLTHRRSL